MTTPELTMTRPKGSRPPVVDAHVDFLEACEVEQRDFLSRSEHGHVDLPRAREGGIGAIFASVYLRPSQVEINALGYAMKYMDDLLRFIDRSDGELELVRTADQLRTVLDSSTLGLILHLEGAEPISPSLKELRVLYEVGLRSLGIVHARRNIFGAGVPIPWSPTGQIHGIPRSMHDYGLRNGRTLDPPVQGLTDLGRELVYECQQLGIVVDVSHLTEQGFYDVLGVAQRPVIASHSCAQAVSPHPRNLTDDQLRALAANGGVVGMNLMVVFVRPDMTRDTDTPIEAVLAHIDHMVNVIGDEHVGIGTDFDGAVMPDSVRDATLMKDLVAAMEKQLGYSEERVERICNGNFVRVLQDAWKE